MITQPKRFFCTPYIRTITTDVRLCSLFSLSSIGLTASEIQQLAGHFRENPKPTELDLSGNGITDFPSGRFSNVRRLNCSNNRLSLTSLHTLRLFPDVVDLDVRDNPELVDEVGNECEE